MKYRGVVEKYSKNPILRHEDSLNVQNASASMILSVLAGGKYYIMCGGVWKSSLFWLFFGQKTGEYQRKTKK